MKAVYPEAPLPPEQVRAWYEADLLKMSEEMTGLMVKKNSFVSGAQSPDAGPRQICKKFRIYPGFQTDNLRLKQIVHPSLKCLPPHFR